MRRLQLVTVTAVLLASLPSRAAGGGGVTRERQDGPDASYESWEELEARFGCGSEEAASACVERIRTALRAELAAPALALARVGKCTPEPAGPCAFVFDDCATRAQLYLYALEKLGPDASSATPEVLQALRRGTALEESALRVLVNARSPEALSFIDKRLDSDDVECRWSAFRGAEALGPVAAKLRPHFERVALEGDWHDRQDAVKALSAMEGVASVGALRRVLARPPLSAQVAALNALESLGAAAKEAAPELAWTAQHHWSPDVRCRASKVSKAVTGASVPPASCLGPRSALKDNAVVLPGGDRVVLETLSHGTFQGKATGPCAGADLRHASFVLARGEACLVGIDEGEWGGALVEYRGGKHRTLRKTWYLNPLRTVEAHGHLFVLEGMDHIGRSPGAVAELVEGPEGWRAEPLFEPGVPLRAVGHTAAGDLLLAGEQHVPMEAAACVETAACGSSFLFRIDAHGEVSWVP